MFGMKRRAFITLLSGAPDTAPGGGTYYFRDFEAAARSSKVESIAARARSDAEIEAVVTSLGGEPGGGLIVMPDYFMFIHSRPIILLAARNNVPTIYPWRSTVSGYIEGQNLHIAFRWADGQFARLPSLAEVIVAVGGVNAAFAPSLRRRRSRLCL